MEISNLLGVESKCTVAVIGCGGKTSLIELVASKQTDKKVLISPTTKIKPIIKSWVTLCQTVRECEGHEPRTGVQCVGILNIQTGKLEALPEPMLAGLVAQYDISLLEADGSRGLPCKGWLDYEPAIPDYCTHTVGVVTMAPIGKAANECIIHRLPAFLELTGLRQGDTITMTALVKMVCSPHGMFKNNAGRRYLVVNQVENNDDARLARSFLNDIKNNQPGFFSKHIFGSVHNDVWQEA